MGNHGKQRLNAIHPHVQTQPPHRDRNSRGLEERQRKLGALALSQGLHIGKAHPGTAVAALALQVVQVADTPALNVREGSDGERIRCQQPIHS
jgi:hypothetical protein